MFCISTSGVVSLAAFRIIGNYVTIYVCLVTHCTAMCYCLCKMSMKIIINIFVMAHIDCFMYAKLIVGYFR